jgi:hypothetical protein
LDKGFYAEGEVRLHSVSVGGNVQCGGGRFINRSAANDGQATNGEAGVALNADNINVAGSVALANGFEAQGQVRLPHATIGGNLECNGGHFLNKDGWSLIAAKAVVAGNAFFCDGFTSHGKINLTGATVSGCLDWSKVASPNELTLCLQHAKIGILRDEEKCWPESGKLFLNGFTYEAIDDNAPTDAETRIKWLRLQRVDRFWPQPYEQLASALRSAGHDANAKKVLIAKNKDRVARGPDLTWPEWFWHRVFGPVVGYGYRPLRALWLILGVVMLGYLFFGIGFRAKIMTSTSDNGPKASSLVYSLDMFVPLVDLHQAKGWVPNADGGKNLWLLHTGDLLRIYMWFHVIAGWVLTTMFVVGLTGKIKS